jgi:NAD(P)H-nitrite reductase large subunit
VIDCKLLVAAIGVMPDIGMVRAAGIQTEKGIIVDKYMKTSAKNIYSAGDVVITEDILAGTQRNLAIWPLAVRQGRIAGTNMAQAATLNASKQKASYDGGFLMNSFEILGIPVISIGASRIEESEDENIKVYKHYKPENNIYRKIITRDEKVIGALFIGSIDRAGIYTGLISNSVDISDIRKNIAAEDFGIIQLPADYKKHLVTGDGIEV